MESEIKQLLRLDRSQIEDAAETLARSFRDYSLFEYFYPELSEREKRMSPNFRCNIKRCLISGEAYATSSCMEGIALWLPSDNVEPTLWQKLRCGQIGLALTETRAALRKMKLFNDYILPLHKRLMPQKHMYLWILGVDPAFQGEHLTTRLLAPMLSRLDRQEIPCFVETHAEKNVPVYQHFGFEIMDKSILPGTQIGHWSLGRKPHAPIS